MPINLWLALMIIATLIAGFTGGMLYSYTHSGNEVIDQCNSYIEDHCLCYQYKPSGIFEPNVSWRENE
jgi:archaellum component FlaF (FlaF/FlaG flagellin family)